MEGQAIKRAAIIFIVLGLGGLAVVGRLIQLQVVEHDEWAALARSIQEDVVELPARRGTIYDRNGFPLAYDIPAYDVALDNYHMTKPELLIEVLVLELEMKRADAESKVYRASYFTWIARQLDRDVGERLMVRARELGIRGLIFFDTWKRAYPAGPLAMEVIGVVGLDGYGLEGLEYVFDEELRGRPRRLWVLRNARGDAYDLSWEDQGCPGADLRLTLDARIQRICEQELDRGMEEYQATRSFAIVIDPDTGEILALAQSPRYGPENQDPRFLHPWAVTDAFEPGSTFKAMVGLAALDLGLVTPDDMFSGDSPIVVARVPIKNANGTSYGLVDFRRAMVQSINTVLVQVAQRLGIEQAYQSLVRMGFGTPTGIELPSETPGIIRPPEEWTTVDLATAAFGQGVAVSGVQLAAAFGALANGGTLYRPRLVTGSPAPVDHIASPESCATMRTILREAVQQPGSTGHAAAAPGFDVGGKSGTAQKAFPGQGYVPGYYMGVMAAFFPVDKPEYVLVAAYDEPRSAVYWGGSTAGTTVKNIILGLATAEIVRPHTGTTALGLSG